MADKTSPQDKAGSGPTDPESLDALADRLEAALDRIVRRLDNSGPGQPIGEVAARLDGLIGRLRDVLGHSQD